jgi:GNAT superfamily N-acetyltransferase
MAYKIRKAHIEECAALARLIAISARELSIHDYTAEQIEGALRGTYGVDSQLVKDGTFFVVEDDKQIVGCGGWSSRRTIFGGDHFGQRDDAALDPRVDAAKIRAFFIHPDHARKGIAKLILTHCEAAAIACGFSRFELMATLPGLPFYASQGYEQGVSILHPLGDGLTIEFVPMTKAARLPPKT